MGRRWRLFPKYALLIVSVVGGMLIASGATGVYFSWRETEANLVALQVEKAESAANRIEQYILDIAHQISWTGLSTASADTDALEERRFEFVKLFKQVPAITEAAWIDAGGHEQLRISRLARNTMRAGVDLSQDPAFRGASDGRIYYGPVYFRKGTEPYMTIARPAGGGVATAEVNLKFVWEVVSRIRIGEKGAAYVVDDAGVLIAHPDISLVLRKTDLNTLPQVVALKQAAGPAPAPARGIDGGPVLSAHAPIPSLRWTVFVESPEAEAFAPLRASILRAGLLLAAGLLVATVASFFVARALVRPLRELQEGAARIGAGELDRRIEIRTGDELEGLAEQFNRMSAQLRESYAGLERKVEQRTAELTESLKQQTATSEVLKLISRSTFDLDIVLKTLLENAAGLCNAEGGVLYRSDAAGNYLPLVVFRADADEAMCGRYRQYLQDHPIRINDGSVAGRAVRLRKPVHVEDVGSDPDYRRLDLTEQGDFRNVLAVPLLRDGEPIGVIALSNTARGSSFAASQIELVTTFADQAAIAIENVRLFNETNEALQRQTATAEVLQVISGSVADTAPVFEKILESCAHLFASNEQGILALGEDGGVNLVAHRGRARERLAGMFPSGPSEGFGALLIERGALHFKDVLADVDVPPGVRAIADRLGIGSYSQVFAPMLWKGQPIGTLYVARQPPVGFTDKEIELLRTFADQAVIAVQNARLFNETKEALEQQIATSDVLQAISSSVADTAPVFDKILSGCERLFNGNQLIIFVIDENDRLAIGAIRGPDPERVERARRIFPVPLAGTASEQAIVEGRLVTYADVLNEPGVPEGLRRIARQFGQTYSVAVVPMLWEGKAIGSILVGRDELRAFDAKEQRLLRTFADQAVIAIQNARLFNETKEALERQTATAEVLQVISNSVSDVKPVFDTILDSCARLFNVEGSIINLVGDDGKLHFGAAHAHATANPSPGWTQDELQRRLDLVRSLFPVPLAGSGAELAFRARQPIVFPDVRNGADVPPSIRDPAVRMDLNYSLLLAPLMEGERGIGAISLSRRSLGNFSDKERTLLRTFADQAVIAIRNARLFNETKEALEQQTATAEVLQVISSSVADTQPVFDKILDSCERLFAATGLGIYLVDDQGMLQRGGFRAKNADSVPIVRSVAGEFPRPLAGSTTEMAIRQRRVIHFSDVIVDADAPVPLKRIAEVAGSFSVAFAPMLWEGRGVGAIQVSREPPQPFSGKELALLKTFADQAVIAIQNARLFNELEAKGRELEQANRHKSEFLANMSHELRTPLNAIIGFSEVLSEKMFGEVNEKQLEYLVDIHTSGHHLLSLINDILDLSKIEAGRMELDLAATSLPTLLDNCTTLVRERASRQGLFLALEVEPGVGDWVADVRKLKQVVINLLSNAVKFTPAGGRVTLRARRLEHAVEISVVDTGVGIAADQQALVFEEFRQAGGDFLRKSEGTGLGLSLARRFVELHGGTIRVESAPGRGSTFAFILPERVLEAV